MPQAIGDPEELLSFASALTQYLDNINTETGTIQGHFSALGDTWQDEKKAKFEEDFNALIAQLKQFETTCSEYIPYLQTLAARLQDYLQS